ncbi:MDR family MFS transporter [Enterococcus cecorum]|uniref:Major facilitator superfamily transporter n=1 Tax=Enterococcus cecorum DSM 20682 = ATCC 43198 TaxID=1121864 RepID=S1RJW2_9ENTE|nr:MDR family MFS transporter [Enterococcus cecorum]EOX18215.1 major facilitator superfamily transporter [Enterococcus cecorum DSM 20682 = ATCC 43198]ESK62346.1 major facilitator superfamily transporter [Enterococcus cecorum DSM 20682 = ATCC 43198]OJG32692.1 major facilitator superfamily transporter [Enterococcus cecorum DSM 20682 = ATCC 43198]CAI3341071.1 multidrug efflux MFS transporter [Enterococcus cecorum DSM 20682 = ATCC 43198]SQE55301.1 drug:H+ antiporter-2 (14 Spanner) (DHA2) family dr
MKDFTAVDIYGKKYNRGLLVVVLLIGTFCTVLNQTLLATAFPTLMKEFDISASTVQWLTTGFLLVNGIMIPVSAWLINSFSSKKLYISAMTTFLIGTIICFLAQNFSVLLIGRLIQAIGVGLSMPLLQNIMLTIFPPEKRGSAMGMAGIVIGLAPALGPTLSGWIIDHYSWRDLFGMVIPIVILVLVLALFFMKSVIELTHPKIDTISAILSTIGFGSLLYGFSSVGDKGWLSKEVLGFLIIGIIFIFLFSKRQLKIEHPFLELRVFKSKIFTIAAVLAGVTNMAMIGAEMVLPLYIQNIRGESAFHSGLMLLPGALVMGLMMPITGAIFDKRGARKLAITGMFILTSATLPFAFLTSKTSVIVIVVLYAIRMFGISMVMMPVTTSGMNALPAHLISHGTAVNNTFRQVASSIGTAILISVLTNVTKNNLPTKSILEATPLAYKDQAINATLSGYHAAFLVAVIFGFIGWLITFTLAKKKNYVQGGDK